MATETAAPAAPATHSSAVPIGDGGPADRASLIAELEGMGPPSDEAPMVEESAPEPAAETAADAEETPAAEPEADADNDEGDTEKVAAKADDGAKDDPQLAKRLDAVSKAEKRAKEGVAKAREEFEREKAEWKASIGAKSEAVARFEELAKRVKYDPTGVLLALDPDVDLEYAARHNFDHSKAAAADPKRKEHALRTMREREQADKVERIEREFSEFRQRVEREKAEAESLQRKAAYLDNATKAANEETPIVSSMLAKNRAVALSRLDQVTQYLYEQTGETPDAADAVKELEKIERELLIERGIDPDVIAGAPRAAATNGKKPGKTLSADLGSATKPRPVSTPKSKAEERAEIVRALEAGALD